MSDPLDEFHTRSEAEYEDALSRFPYPLTIVHGEDALAEYERLRLKGDVSPIVLGGPSEFALVHEVYERGLQFEPSTQIILDRAAEIRFPETYRATKSSLLALVRKVFPEISGNDEELHGEFIGEWPEHVVADPFSLSAAYDVMSGRPWPRVHIATLPTKDWTEIPAYLRAGGWNDMPDAAVLTSALRSWRDRFGADLVGFAYDVMDLRVARPPSSRDEASELAGEHVLFCSDALNEATVRELAAGLIANDWWRFWWD